MVRGFERILKGRDPPDAWAFTERACGVCTTVHALASVFGGKNPHPNYLVGGVPCSVNLDESNALNAERLAYVGKLLDIEELHLRASTGARRACREATPESPQR